jgi:hypothetical protein
MLRRCVIGHSSEADDRKVLSTIFCFAVGEYAPAYHGFAGPVYVIPFFPHIV